MITFLCFHLQLMPFSSHTFTTRCQLPRHHYCHLEWQHRKHDYMNLKEEHKEITNKHLRN
jgi:hypothetical protein